MAVKSKRNMKFQIHSNTSKIYIYIYILNGADICFAKKMVQTCICRFDTCSHMLIAKTDNVYSYRQIRGGLKAEIPVQ